MLGIVGFPPVCGVLLERSQMKSDAVRPSQQTTLTRFAKGGESIPPLLRFCSLDHLTQTLQHDNAVQSNGRSERPKSVLECKESSVGRDLPFGSLRPEQV